MMAQILKEHHVESKEFLAKELFNERKFEKAFPLTLEADRNDPQIVYNLGFMYYFGKGVKCDRKKGAEFVRFADAFDLPVLTLTNAVKLDATVASEKEILGAAAGFAAELASAVETREQIRDFAESGGRVLAECGGMIYLTHMIVGVEKGPFPMCGVLPCAATMEGARLHLGYRRIVDAAGRTWKGHEFHYSRLDRPDMLPSVARQFNARGEHVVTALYRYKNVFAGYTHLYWGENDIMQWWDE